MINLDYDYDPRADSLFVWSKNKYQYDFSFTIDDDIVIDIDCNSLPVAFEFFNASRWFNVKKSDFNHIESIKILVEINEKFICLNADLVVLANDVHIYRIRTNLDKFPTNEYEFSLKN